MAHSPVVDATKCNGCEKCVDVCSVEIFEMNEDKAEVVNPEECIGCKSCIEICKKHAISIRDKTVVPANLGTSTFVVDILH